MRNIVIVDIDGTLADPGRFERKSDFFKRDCRNDKPIEPVIRVVRLFHGAGSTIVLLSGREEKHRPATEEWLGTHAVPFHRLHMRPTGDFRADHHIKLELVERHIDNPRKILCAIDDRRSILDLWHKLGIFTFDVSQGMGDADRWLRASTTK